MGCAATVPLLVLLMLLLFETSDEFEVLLLSAIVIVLLLAPLFVVIKIKSEDGTEGFFTLSPDLPLAIVDGAVVVVAAAAVVVFIRLDDATWVSTVQCGLPTMTACEVLLVVTCCLSCFVLSALLLLELFFMGLVVCCVDWGIGVAAAAAAAAAAVVVVVVEVAIR